jgi:hypothetical protein
MVFAVEPGIWYKLKPQLESIGHKVTALDLTACNINTHKIEDVRTLAMDKFPEKLKLEFSWQLLFLMISNTNHHM